jgi:membrane glycosyltransferase
MMHILSTIFSSDELTAVALYSHPSTVRRAIITSFLARIELAAIHVAQQFQKPLLGHTQAANHDTEKKIESISESTSDSASDAVAVALWNDNVARLLGMVDAVRAGLTATLSRQAENELQDSLNLRAVLLGSLLR